MVMPEVDAEQFAAATSPYRRELFAHCYRMTGSLAEVAEARTAASSTSLSEPRCGQVSKISLAGSLTRSRRSAESAIAALSSAVTPGCPDLSAQMNS